MHNNIKEDANMSQITKSLPLTGNINPYPTSYLNAGKPALAWMDAMKKTNEVAISGCCQSSFDALRRGLLFLSAGTNFLAAMKILMLCQQEMEVNPVYAVYWPSLEPEVVAADQILRHSVSRMISATIIGGLGYLGEHLRPSFDAHICPLFCLSATNTSVHEK